MENATVIDGELGAFCPHCGVFHGLGIHGEEEFEPNPHRDDNVAEVVCHNCNGSFKIKV